MMCTFLICTIILMPFTVFASNGKAPDHSKAEEKKETVEQKRETPNTKQKNKKDKGAEPSVDSKADSKPKSQTKPPEPTSKAPDHSNADRSENSVHKGKSGEASEKKRDDRGNPPDHAKADKEKQPNMDKHIEEKVDPELPVKEEVPSDSPSLSPSVEHIEREVKQNDSTSHKENPSSNKKEAPSTKANVHKRPVQKPVPSPERLPTPQPVKDGITFSYSSQKAGSKSGKDRSFSHDTTVWTAVNMIGSSGGQDLRYILVSRHHMLRSQWMNAPPEQPPKMSPLFS
ncbi:hypothetical protein H0266_16510 [Halobacillus locisalis]|uniref:Uncharacterized protein n=1 Tax=Halobacillus locisalis TaxID=220753 RepID=A0A838CX47_9BACI|nr:hypothetical protein [Halobacillus locisalis]MBA2176503.1 hypothetical protein [Halobacillus locisalis]